MTRGETMTDSMRKLILRANAIFLLAASAGGLVTDVHLSFFGSGPLAGILAAACGAPRPFARGTSLRPQSTSSKDSPTHRPAARSWFFSAKHPGCAQSTF
jgi:hypothetical protein